MLKSIVLGGVLGGLIVFGWGFVSWEVFPYHRESLSKFEDEAAVTKLVEANAPESGIYVTPYQPEDMSAPEQEAWMKEKMDDTFLFVSVHREGWGSMLTAMGLYLLVDIVAAALLTVVLRRLRAGFLGKVWFGTLIATAMGLAVLGPYWVFWHFPPEYVVLGFLDVVIGWGLASIAIAAVTGGRPARAVAGL